jgi:signal transduction histidine kinase
MAGRWQMNPLKFGILGKLLISFLLVACIPLVILGYIAHKNLYDMGTEAERRTGDMGCRNLQSAVKIGKEAIADSVRELDKKSTEAIELRTYELAQRVADFLYERDQDILVLAASEPDSRRYLQIYRSCQRQVIIPGPWPPKQKETPPSALECQNPENQTSWRHLPPYQFQKATIPLYKEITFIDLKGREQIKVAHGHISPDLRDVSRKENTYCQAEDYFRQLPQLQKGEIYVSRVIGAYVRGWLEKTPEGVKVKPGSAYAGKENPQGQKFAGIIRWATPVYGNNGRKIGYVTLALDHTHIMEFTDHVIPTEERFTALSDGASGNYAFMWDDQDKCISHARDFFICGYDPETGKEVPGWVSKETYSEYMQSGLSLEEFVKRLPSFRKFTMKKQGAKEQLRAGTISLDGRILDTAPQCQGWHNGTEDGGSGSFLIYWSGLWKLTTYAAIPYYTGIYGKSQRGFGYVTIGANVADFHKAANATKVEIEKSIQEQSKDIKAVTTENRKMLDASTNKNRWAIIGVALLAALGVCAAATVISVNITRPLKELTAGALAMTRGNLHQTITVKSRDEVGKLARSFNDMAAVVSKVDQMKSEFVTIASHELRTPIQAMLLSISGLLAGYSGNIDQEAREDLEMARDGIERLMRLVDALLDLSRIEARKMELHPVRTSIGAITARALEETGALAAAHNHQIVLQVPADLPEIEVDQDRMVQVTINLLSNSIKYTPQGGKIILNARNQGQELVLTVADNGYGIPAWAQEEVFKKFFQADSIMSQKVGGTGLGLTISKGIVEEHGGSISCRSPLAPEQFPELPLGGERQGTVFEVRLPLG